MPKRQSVVRIDSTVVQGDGSFVELSRAKVADIKAMIQKYGNSFATTDDASMDSMLANVEAAREMLVRLVHKWNWVDDDDQPMPQIHDDPNVLELLTVEEMTFLMKQVTGGEVIEDRKKK